MTGSERTIFLEALDRADPAERAAFLDRACGDKAELRHRVERLLEAIDGAGGFMESPAAAGRRRRGPPDPRRARARASGPTSCSKQIGEGGMGVVYMAEQDQPVRRKVALKIIKPGMDTGQVDRPLRGRAPGPGADGPPQHRPGPRRRHHRHRPALLRHGAGQGRARSPSTATSNQLTPRERLELFVPVCQAIQHAHQKGIIHRDIKPSNVLVTLYDGKPVPKVIDFGVAKAIDQRLTEQTLFTQFGAIVGTLEYMSPEQAELERAGRRHAQRHLLAGRAALRAADRHDAAGAAAAARGGVLPRSCGGSARRSRRSPSTRLSRLERDAAVDRGAAQDRAGPADEAGARRARLDRDEGAGEGPGAAVRDGQRPGPRHRALPGRRAGGGRPAVGRVPAAQAGAEADPRASSSDGGDRASILTLLLSPRSAPSSHQRADAGRARPRRGAR